MSAIDAVTRALVDVTITLANGVLVTAYFALDHLAQGIAIAAALAIGLTFDRLVQREAVFAPARYGGGAAPPARVPRTAQATTALALGLWLLAAWSFGPPVPSLGAAMWALAALALLVMPEQRWSLLWSTKAGLILYALAVLAYRAYAWQASRLSPAELALAFGGSEGASRVLAQQSGTLATVGAWLLWVVLPLGYGAMLLQNWAAQPMGIVHPFRGARDVIAALRTRGGESE